MNAERKLGSADYFVRVILPIVKDDKLLLKALENINRSVVLSISSILKVEHLYKNVVLKKDSQHNLDLFFKNCAKKYGLCSEDISVLREILFISRKHRESGLEFSRNRKVFIVDDELENFWLDVEKIKRYVIVSRKLLENTNRKFSENFRKVFK